MQGEETGGGVLDYPERATQGVHEPEGLRLARTDVQGGGRQKGRMEGSERSQDVRVECAKCRIKWKEGREQRISKRCQRWGAEII